MTLDRRSLLAGTAAIGLSGLAGMFGLPPAWADDRPAAPFKLTDAEWRKRLSPLAYQVLRESATERPFTSPLLQEHRKGIFQCAGCYLPLFDSKTKYDSHTGWPSFWQPLPKAVATSSDNELGYVRTEVHCIRCAGHLAMSSTMGPSRRGCATAWTGWR